MMICHFTDLPQDVIDLVLTHLSWPDVGHLAQTDRCCQEYASQYIKGLAQQMPSGEPNREELLKKFIHVCPKSWGPSGTFLKELANITLGRCNAPSVERFSQALRLMRVGGILSDRDANSIPMLLAAIQCGRIFLLQKSTQLRADPKFLELAQSINPLSLDAAALPLQWEYIRQNGLLLRYTPSRQDELFFVLEAVKQNGLALQYAGNGPRYNQDIARAAVQQNGLALQFVPKDLQCQCPEIAQSAVDQNGLALQFVSGALQCTCPPISKRAARQNGLALQFVSQQLQCTCPNIVEVAVANNPAAIAYALSRDLVIDMAAKNVRLLQFLDGDDTALMQAIVRLNGNALQYASKRLQDDPLTVAIAFLAHPQALIFASKRLQDSEVLASIRSCV